MYYYVVSLLHSGIIVLSCSFTVKNHSKMESCHRGSDIQDREWVRKAAVAKIMSFTFSLSPVGC